MKTDFTMANIKPWSQKFWEGTREEKLLLPKCEKCDLIVFYPKKHCPKCRGKSFNWVEASGNGKIYSYSIMYYNPPSPFAKDVPYVLAIIELEEGVRLMSNIIDTPFEKLKCEAKVEVTYRDLNDEITLPLFKLCES